MSTSARGSRDLGVFATAAFALTLVLYAPAVRSQDDTGQLEARIAALEAAKSELSARLDDAESEIARLETSLTPMVEALELNVSELMGLCFQRSGTDLVLSVGGSELRIGPTELRATGGTRLRLEADDVDVVGGQTLDASAPKTTLLGSSAAELSGASVRVTASSKVRVDGPVTQIGNGSRAVARVGDAVVNGKIVSGSSQMLCP